MLTEKQYSLLYLEDEQHIREMVVLYLNDFFSVIYEAHNGVEGLKIFDDKKPDMIITDIQMPQMSGLTFAKKIREKNRTIPIMMLTAHTSTEYLLQAVELGLIKYLLKPINENELHDGLVKCFETLEFFSPNVIRLTTEYSYDTLNHTLIFSDQVISLTPSQTKFLDLLIKYKFRAVSYKEIENYIWYDKGMSEAAIRSLVHDLRQILGKKVIKNISKIGYKLQLL